VVLAGLLTAGSARADAQRGSVATSCSGGPHTLAPLRSKIYPDTGNGGYLSVHTDVHLIYNATTNRFLRGNHVVLDDRATQCLTSFSLDFERKSADATAGPDLKVGSVFVDGRPARYTFVQPAYPGDPHGPSDPNPLAHEMSQKDPVGGPGHNPLPPACTPELLNSKASGEFAQDGKQCPANKLVIEPTAPIRDGAAFTVSVYYAGRPGVHNDGDGTKEGWFRAPGGSLVSTEPVGSEDWMPLNNYPTAKPSYDFYDTVNAGKTAVANGILVSVTHHPASPEFTRGSVTWHWNSPEPVASYLVQSSVGNYALTERTGRDGIRYYEAQDTSISPAHQKKNLAIMNKQQNITHWESQFNGPYPFSSGGIVIGTPNVDSGQEEMQTMISMDDGSINLPTLYHENNHQWWGDNVTEHTYSMTFFKEGFGQLAQWLLKARTAQNGAGLAAFERTLVHLFNKTYGYGGPFWTGAPSNPLPWTLFANDSTYMRPAAAYVALRQILGGTRWAGALKQIQRDYGGATITEPQEEVIFHRWMPNRSAACQAKLTRFFAQWWDTAYRSGGGRNRPQITGPGLAGPGFYHRHGGC
jgi:hypothetical protein